VSYHRLVGSPISLSLDAVIVAVTDEAPRILTVTDASGVPAIPSGRFDATADATLELGLRRVVDEQTGLSVGYAEQLYTFGDRNRGGRADRGRHLSIAYLALVREARPAPGAAWVDVYDLFPWEDHRAGRPPVLAATIEPRLARWADDDGERNARFRVSFGVDAPWDPVRTLERYELLYEAGLVAEAARDRGASPSTDLVPGVDLSFDHRRIAATALGRLRGKLSYRPVVFELMPATFSLTQLQRTVEALIGMRVHKQNFRRLVERERLVEGTGTHAPSTGGRPAELFRFRREVLGERPRPGMRLPPFRG